MGSFSDQFGGPDYGASTALPASTISSLSIDPSSLSDYLPMNVSPVTDLSGLGAIPSTVGAASSGLGSGLGFNVGTGQLALGGLGAISSLITGLGGLSLAKKNYNLAKATGQANLTNSIQSYNTALADKERSRAVVEGQTADQQAAYLQQNQLAPVKL